MKTMITRKKDSPIYLACLIVFTFVSSISGCQSRTIKYGEVVTTKVENPNSALLTALVLPEDFSGNWNRATSYKQQELIDPVAENQFLIEIAQADFISFHKKDSSLLTVIHKLQKYKQSTSGIVINVMEYLETSETIFSPQLPVISSPVETACGIRVEPEQISFLCRVIVRYPNIISTFDISIYTAPNGLGRADVEEILGLSLILVDQRIDLLIQ